MVKYILKRSAWAFLTLLAVITVTFYLVGNAFSDACDPRNHV